MSNACFFTLSLSLSTTAFAAEIQIAVASNFSMPMQKIATAFELKTGHKVVLSSGAIGKFYTQNSNGAPFEILLAADNETPARLEKRRSGQHLHCGPHYQTFI